VRDGKQGFRGNCKRVAGQTWSLDKRTFHLVSVSLAGGVRSRECGYPTGNPQGGTSGMTYGLVLQMALIYAGIPEYEGVIIKNLR
jgi:hypothetical protein